MKKENASKSKAMDKEEPNSSIISEVPSTEVLTENQKTILMEGFVQAPVIQREMEEKPSFPPLPKASETNQPTIISLSIRTPTKPKQKPWEKVAVKEEKQPHANKLGKSQKEASTVSEEEHLPLNKRKVMKKTRKTMSIPN